MSDGIVPSVYRRHPVRINNVRILMYYQMLNIYIFNNIGRIPGATHGARLGIAGLFPAKVARRINEPWRRAPPMRGRPVGVWVATFCCLVFLAPSNLRLATAAKPKCGDGQPEVLADIQVEKNGGPIILRVSVQPSRGALAGAARTEMYNMLLDTGAACSCFDLAHRKMLGEPIDGQHSMVASGQLGVESFEAPDMRIGDLDIRPRNVVSIDAEGNVRIRPANVTCASLEWLSRLLGEKIDGLLGMDSLRTTVISIDFELGRLQFLRTAPKDLQNPIAILRSDRSGDSRPFVKVAFGDSTEVMLVDTGGISNCSGAIEASAYRRLWRTGALAPAISPNAPRKTSSLATIGGPQEVPFARAQSFFLGDRKHNNLVFVPHPRISTLGLGYLSRYSVSFDFPNNAMYLRPSKAYARNDICFDLTSFVVARNADGVVVDSVREGGWGAKAGVKTGDSVLAINGRTTAQLSLFAIRRMLAVETLQILTLRRDGARQRVVIDATADVERFFNQKGTAEILQPDNTNGVNVNGM